MYGFSSEKCVSVFVAIINVWYGMHMCACSLCLCIKIKVGREEEEEVGGSTKEALRLSLYKIAIYSLHFTT